MCLPDPEQREFYGGPGAGTDFCSMARQRRLAIDGEDYHVDLVFYHRALRCLVLVDLKLGAFAPADAA
jgi:predicted nuclease of restriction endonuclease-like (RecB) superfamily